MRAINDAMYYYTGCVCVCIRLVSVRVGFIRAKTLMCVIIFLKLNNAFEGDGFSSYLRHVWLFLLHASFLLTYCRTVAHAIWLQFDMDTSMFKQMKPQNKIGYTMLCFALLQYHAFTYQRSGAYNDNRKNDRAHVKYTRIGKTCRIQISPPKYIACK